MEGARDSTNASGGERFDILRRLGSGGMGIVYEAYDRERDSVVALKTLRRLDPGALYRFKKEFRALSDIAHTNLVTLHELVSSGEEWFFTMELIRGVTFLQYVRPSSTSDDADTWHDSEGPPLSASTLRIESDEDAIDSSDATDQVKAAVRPGDLDFTRLRECLEQLVKGVIALHDAGRLHRDIKPSNVLVTREGRVVLCDFGLVTELSRDEPYSSSTEHVAGTVPYMSPEQAASGLLTEASDWYSVGVVLYEALTARVPFEGQGRDALRLKQVLEPPAPSELEKGIPADLDRLCRDLLRIEPEHRPTGVEILGQLSCQTPLPVRAPMSRLSQPPVPLVGRRKELAELRAAFDDSAVGRAVEVRVHGSSGIGKTALVRQFLDELTQGDEAVVLTGRCYERESIPYNALDSLMDRLSTYLVRLSGTDVEAIMPRDVVALARLFPVLRRVEAAAVPQQRGIAAADPQESRRRAFYALRELLDNLARRRPLVLFIDDLQWGDADSVALLEELMRPPEPPPLLLVTAHRAEDAATDPFRRPRRRRATTRHEIIDAREIFLESLSIDEAHELALALLGDDDEAMAHADTIAAESGGSPFLVYSLVRHVMAGSSLDREGTGKATIAEVLRTRIAKLPPMARSVLEAVAVAGRPITRAVVESTVGTETDAQRTLAVLRAEHLLRTQRLKAQDAIETYHDSIRQAVIDQLSADELREYHLRLARALHAVGQADPEELVEHWLAGGEREAAGDDALAAGDQAVRALAFGRAAWQYQRALELKKMPRSQERETQSKLGDALSNSGRGAEAARAYMAAAEGAAAGAALDLQRRAALQLLRSGHIDEGLTALSHVLYMVGMELPRDARSARSSLLWNRARLLLRGLRFRERDASMLTARELARIDICWSAAVGLAMVDPVRSAYFQAQQLRFALQAGEPYRVARALSVEVPVAALSGERGRRRAQRATHVAKELAEKLDEPILHAWLVAGTALLEYQTGHFRAARNAAEQAVTMLRDDCVGVVWEVTSAELYLLWSLYYLGELDKMSQLAQRLLEDAWQRGDHYAAASLRMGLTNAVWLMVDDPEDARRQVSEAMSGWSRQGFHLQHYWELLALANCDLYEGEGRAAYTRVQETWKRLEESLLLSVELVRVEALHLRARAALAAASQASDPRSLWREALGYARGLERGRGEGGMGLAELVRAGVAVGRGQIERAEALFERAEMHFAAADMALYEAAAKYRRGEIIGGDKGCELMDQVDAWMLGQSVENPERMADVLAPSPVP